MPAKEPHPVPTQAIERLRQGNETFQAGSIDTMRAVVIRRAQVAAGQHPIAAVLSCADSRVPPELVFNQGLGDIFVVRTAGAVPDQAVLGSLEYAVEHLHVPVVLVMGHLSCGAVKAAMETPPPVKPDPAGLNLERILMAIRPSLKQLPVQGDRWENAVYATVEQNIADVVRLSPVLAQAGRSGHVTFLGAVYELESGKVNFSAPVVFRPRPGHLAAPATASLEGRK
ncbi:MAG: carbonic anhydrase [Candidatus Solibacter usitatus]|nr:carbonic anhydrase [Candidatus Solibacter usitatus]